MESLYIRLGRGSRTCSGNALIMVSPFASISDILQWARIVSKDLSRRRYRRGSHRKVDRDSKGLVGRGGFQQLSLGE